MMPRIMLRWGLNSELPGNAKAAWGCRAIFSGRYPDIVWDRQDSWGESEELRQALLSRVGNANGDIREAFSSLVDAGLLRPRDDKTIGLYEDEVIKVVGNPRNSYGYVYMTAWLKEQPG